VWRESARTFGFDEVDGPILEPLDLYRQKSGDEIVSQLFHFVDKGDREVSLRPEMTPTVARMVGARASALRRPVKWFAIAENFRYERQQKGRLRAHYQFNADVFGEPGVGAEAELLALLVHTLTRFGLQAQDVHIRLSDRQLWALWLQQQGLDADAVKAALIVLDKAERERPEKLRERLRSEVGPEHEDLRERAAVLIEARSLDALAAAFGPDGPSAEAKERLTQWEELLGRVDALGIRPFLTIDPGIVRGLAYYTGFVFEVFPREGESRSIAGGGRYDELVSKLGSGALPAVGFGLGDVTLGQFLQERGLAPAYVPQVDAYLVAGGGPELSLALSDATELRQSGLMVEYSLKAVGLSKGLKQASQRGARFVVLYGLQEVAADRVRVKRLADGAEEDVPRSHLTAYLRDSDDESA
jgi:histidyl-tRNA synthetase